MITVDDLRAVCPATKLATLQAIVDPLNAAMREHAIDTPEREAMFLAHLVLESGGFHYLRELASGDAYEGRADLGNTEQGDGRRFKGWGWMQTTGRKNTAIVSQALYGDNRLVDNPALINPPSIELAARAAGHFWTVGAGLNLSQRAKAHGLTEGVNLNDVADKGDFLGTTLAVNGGLNGYPERQTYYHKLQTIIT